MSHPLVLLFVSLLCIQIGCESQGNSPAAVPPSGLAGSNPQAAPALPQGHPPVGNQAQAPAAPQLPATPNHGGVQVQQAQDVKLVGTVVETFNAASYTYVKFKDDSAKEQWAAILKVDLKQGQKIEVNQQMVMDNFQSKSLNRTFDRIIFGTAKVLQ